MVTHPFLVEPPPIQTTTTVLQIPVAKTRQLYAMYLDPSRHRQGWGSQLLEAVSEDLRRSGFTTASLWVMTDNTNARAFYEQAGWAADGKVTEMCLSVDIPAVRYQRAL